MQKLAFGIALCGGVASADILLENADFKLTVGEDACLKSLVVKATGEECLAPDLARRVPLLTVTSQSFP